jgi:hypothetical protein
MLTQKLESKSPDSDVINKLAINSKKHGEWTLELTKEGKLDIRFQRTLTEYEMRLLTYALLPTNQKILKEFYHDDVVYTRFSILHYLIDFFPAIREDTHNLEPNRYPLQQ